MTQMTNSKTSKVEIEIPYRHQLKHAAGQGLVIIFINSRLCRFSRIQYALKNMPPFLGIRYPSVQINLQA